MKGYFDRSRKINYAIILVEELNREFVIPVNELPEGSQPKLGLTL